MDKLESKRPSEASATNNEAPAPIAVVMITLNEAHNLPAVLDNLRGWAREVYIVDSYSSDQTVDIALANGVHVVQRRFRGFGDQWNFALKELPISAPWTMKLDPDERLTDDLKSEIARAIEEGSAEGFSFDRRLWFMGRVIPVEQEVLRVWRTGKCRFTDVSVNEHPIVDGKVVKIGGVLEHHDSPNLHHWYHKQNSYSSSEASREVSGQPLADSPRILGTALQRRMWVKKHFGRVPFRFLAVFLYFYVVQGLWRAGWVGYVWSRLRAQVYFMRHIKAVEMRILGIKEYARVPIGNGGPDPRVKQCD